MKIIEENNNIILKDLTDFDINKIFDCGQCFRFEKQGENAFEGVALGRYLKISQHDDQAVLYDMNKAEFDLLWHNYFNLDLDYGEIKNLISTDDIIIEAVKAGGGIRILRQDLFETVISFIISQNNNIPSIKKIISRLCENYGEKIILKDSQNEEKIYYAFPTPEALAKVETSELRALSCGYRDEYISLFSRSVANGSFSLEKLNSLPTKEAREMLLGVRGIGGKVADCILLFGMARYEVCPHDVWVKRIFSEKYGIEKITEKKGYELASGKWGNYAGIAQQYLFYKERNG